ncbi:MAG: exonuclease domain-containing protein [Planctomycetota bacterium]
MKWQNAKLIALDTETTGLGEEARIVEVGAFMWDGGLETGTRFGQLVNPQQGQVG